MNKYFWLKYYFRREKYFSELKIKYVKFKNYPFMKIKNSDSHRKLELNSQMRDQHKDNWGR